MPRRRVTKLEGDLLRARSRSATARAHFRLAVFHDNNSREGEAIPHSPAPGPATDRFCEKRYGGARGSDGSRGVIQRILVTGNAGSGKTTLVAEIGRAMSLPVFGLDQVVWRAGWTRTPKAERDSSLRALAERPRWAIDGVSSILESAADLVIFLDVSPALCTWRCARRNIRYLFRSRPGLPENCPEWRIAPTLLGIIWRFDRDVRPGILRRARSTRIGQQYWHVADNADRLNVLERLLAVNAEIARAAGA